MGMGESTIPETGDRNLAHLFRMTYRMMARISHRHDHGNHAQARTLSIIRERGQITQKELMALLDIRSSSLSEIIGKLERSGFIKREKNPEDKRGFIISTIPLSKPDGCQEMTSAGMNNENSMFACLNSEEQEQLKKILEKLIESLKSESDAPSHSHGHRRLGRRPRHHGHGPFQGRRFQP